MNSTSVFQQLIICSVSLLALTLFARTWLVLLSLFSLVGMLLLVATNNMLIAFLSLELLSLPLYIMAAMGKRAHSAEAAVKYFLLNGVGLGLLLFGMSLLYGATSTLDVTAVKMLLASHNLLTVAGLVFVIAGLAIKLGLAPFHSWIGDIYAEAPEGLVLFLGTAPKIAIVAWLLNLAAGTQMLLMIGAVSIVIGSISAVAETNMKRLLGWSAVAQLGFAVLSSGLFYVVAYSVMFLGAFTIASIVEDFSGLGKRNPKLAGLMLVFLSGLAGIPPFAGFMAKFSVIYSLFVGHHVFLAVFALIFSIVAAYYYFNVVKRIYFEQPVSSNPVVVPALTKALVTFLGIITLLLGIFPIMGI